MQVAEGVLPDHIRKKMHELLGEEETPRAEISDGAKRQGRAMEEWWARQEARSTRAVRPAEPAIAAAAQATAKSLAAKAAEGWRAARTRGSCRAGGAAIRCGRPSSPTRRRGAREPGKGRENFES